VAFALLAVMIFGYVRVYETKLYIEEQSQKLSQLHTELGDLKKRRQQAEQMVEARAEELGLYRPAYEDMIVIQVPSSR
jgi:hypothetical protein